MTTTNSFVKQFIALVKGDEAEVRALKIWRQCESAFKVQIAALGGDLIRKEDAVSQAEENLAKKLVNNGNEIADRDQYISNLIQAKEILVQSKKQLDAHKATITFLEEQYALLKAE